MKSEHRHELQTNELGKVATRVGSSLEGYGNAIMIGVIVVALVGAGLLWWTRSQSAAGAAGWTQLTTAQSAEDYGNIADEYEDAAVGAWARLREAETHLETGVRLMFTNRESSLADLKRAREAYEKVLAPGSPATEEIQERALFGLARTREATSDGDTGPALEVYERLLTQFPNTVYKQTVENRIEALKTGSAQQFYAWFSKETPAPPESGRPRDFPTTPHGVPPGPSPGGPGMTPPPLPRPPLGGTPAGSAPAEQTTEDPAAPADASTPANAQPPASDTPESETPAEPQDTPAEQPALEEN